MTIESGGQNFDLVSPVEGVVTVGNKDAVAGSGLIARDPYQDGWIAMVKSPDLAHQQEEPGAGRHGRALAAEQRDAAERHGRAAGADDGGRWRLADAGIADAGAPELREKLVKEFFLA